MSLLYVGCMKSQSMTQGDGESTGSVTENKTSNTAGAVVDNSQLNVSDSSDSNEAASGTEDAKNQGSASAKKSGNKTANPSVVPAKVGEELVTVTSPPEQTLSALKVQVGTKSAKFRAEIEPYGIKGSAETPRELVVRIVSWKAIDAKAAKGIPDLTGRNALMNLRLSPNQAEPLLKGGSHKVEVELEVSGEMASLNIIAVV
jgi:hypothetical protein